MKLFDFLVPLISNLLMQLKPTTSVKPRIKPLVLSALSFWISNPKINPMDFLPFFSLPTEACIECPGPSETSSLVTLILPGKKYQNRPQTLHKTLGSVPLVTLRENMSCCLQNYQNNPMYDNVIHMLSQIWSTGAAYFSL